MMKLPHRFLPAVLVAAVVAPVPVAAHSLESLETELRGKEKFLEIRNVPSPDFALQDADGKPVQLTDLRGQVVVLHFVYASCADVRSEEHTSELQSLMRISYAVFCLKKKRKYQDLVIQKPQRQS